VVTRVVDGDTLDCQRVGRVRLIGVDTPEAAQEPYGALASEALARLAPVGSEVLLEADVDPSDRYGRALSYVWRDGVMVNWGMVRAGYALMATFPPNVRYVDDFRAAQERAREDAAGLWAVDGFACPPGDHRAGRCQ
jgi:micrococcal nuclease